MSDNPLPFHVTRCDPDQNMARYYSLTMQPTHFGEISLVRNWGRIGTKGQQKVDTFSKYSELERAYEDLTRQKRRKDTDDLRLRVPAIGNFSRIRLLIKIRLKAVKQRRLLCAPNSVIQVGPTSF
ncbi:WGR domain-containing protein [Phyllobacterium sp. P30BS-XVII]|uniref:WGR domain-containing protein n=1 Tax=Phyllobacterium sp. P30BS-XVII TaxID=2587046 RepID=UPI0015F972D5|nr:WGR domain-containing protein [Phyllobacterium sp. P30BS-XVII]